MRNKVRTLRHWKQRFNRDAKFVWRRPKVYAGKMYKAGDPIPKHLALSPTKLRRFWESHIVELAQFEAPNVQSGIVAPPPADTPPLDIPEGVVVESGNGNWFIVTRGEDTFKANGRAKLEALLDELRKPPEADDNTEDNAEGDDEAAAKAAEKAAAEEAAAEEAARVAEEEAAKKAAKEAAAQEVADRKAAKKARKKARAAQRKNS